MQDIDTTKPSRALDAAVARAMGHTIYMGSPIGWVEWDNVKQTKALAISAGDGTVTTLPYYSTPSDEYDKTGILSMILWLMERNIVLLERIQGKTLVDLTNAGPEVDSEAVEGEPLQALALALCQVVVRVGGLEK